MEEKHRNKEIIESLLRRELPVDNLTTIKGFGYYLASRKEHLYNLGFYIDEAINYEQKVSDLQKKYKLYRDICTFVNKRFSRRERLEHLLPLSITFDDIIVYKKIIRDINADCNVNEDKSIERFSIHNIDKIHIVIKITFGDSDTSYTQETLLKIKISDITVSSIESKRSLIRFIQHIEKKEYRKL